MHLLPKIPCALFSALALSTASAGTDGTIPNQRFSESEQWTIISPQMTDMHLNQPSVFNGYAILAGNAVHEVWDISDPYAPSFEARMTSNHHSGGEAESHQISYGRDEAGNYYFASISGRGVDIWDVTNTTSPTLVGEIILPKINYGDVAGAVWGISWQGNYIFAGATSNGLYVIDVSDPANPEHVTTVSRSNLGGVSAGPLFALGDLLVVTTPKVTSGVATLNISDPTNPFLLDAVDPSNKSYIGGFYGTEAFLITPLSAYDVTTDPTGITVVNSTINVKSEYISFSDDHLFLGGLRGGTQGIWKYDISDRANPVLEGRIQGRAKGFDDQFSCPIGNLIIIADDQLYNNNYAGAIIGVHDTEPDISGPRLLWTSIEDGSFGQSRSGQIGLSFSEWIEFKSVDATSCILRPVGGTAVTGSWSCNYTTLTFAAADFLEPNTTYELVLPAGGITDLVGNPLESTVVTTFTTGAGLPGSTGIITGSNLLRTELGKESRFALPPPDIDQIYTWDFGDGQTENGYNVSNTYSAPGRYTVKYTVKKLPQVYREAEDANRLGGVSISAKHAGGSGGLYADFPGAQGDDVKIEWTVNMEAAVIADLNFRYANGSSKARSLNVLVNGSSPREDPLPIAPTGDWSIWANEIVESVSLNAGDNTITLIANAGAIGPNIDYLEVRSPLGTTDIGSYSFTHIVHRPLSPTQPRQSSALLLDGGYVWSVNPDANTVSAVNTTTLTKDYEIGVSQEPKAIAKAPDGTLWVTCRQSWSISIIDPSTQSVVDSIALPYASQPSGLVFSQDNSAAFVTLEALGQVLRIDLSNRAVVGTLDLGPDSNGIVPHIRGIAINSDGDTLYVTRFISPDDNGVVYEIDVASFSLTREIALAKSTGSDSSQFSRGLPNYLASIAISPDGARAWIPSKKDNIDRGGARDGLELDHDVTVRAITSSIDLANSEEVLAERVDHDNGDRCHAAAFSPYGDLVFITMPGNHEVRIVDAYSGESINTLSTKDVPEGILLDEATGTLYVQNFLGRNLSVFDVSPLLRGESTSEWLADIPLLDNEPLTAEVLEGKKLFYDAKSLTINSSGYMSCASCHLDGSHDGRTFDFTAPMGEGFRNTIDLRGRSGTGHGRVHWTGNFDEVHDFESQLRLLGKGVGLMDDSDFNEGTRSQSLGDPKTGYSVALDALAAYLTSLDEVPPSPHRDPAGSLTHDAILGKAHFNSLGCFSCHGGDSYTDSSLGTLHDVGTLRDTSGSRMSENLTGLDTPTLRGIWASAPYLHDGSASTLHDVLVTRNPSDQHGAVSTLNDAELNQLIAYLKQIDSSEAPALAVTAVGAKSFDNFIQDNGLNGAEASPDADPDGDGWSNEAEFTMGGSDPNMGGSQPKVLAAMTKEETGDHLELSWLRREGGSWNGTGYQWGDFVYIPQASADLSDWSLDMITIPNPEDLPNAPAGYEWTTSRIMAPAESLPNAFIRLVVED